MTRHLSERRLLPILFAGRIGLGSDSFLLWKLHSVPLVRPVSLRVVVVAPLLVMAQIGAFVMLAP